MLLAGLQKLTLLDYAEKPACTVFTCGCNFRCGFCHNAGLVTENNQDFLKEEDFFSFLKKRQGLLDAVCITGGEPTLHKNLPEFCRKIKALGYLLKLDTNGTNPEMLKKLINEKLIDYVAMDIKSSIPRYYEAAGTNRFELSSVLKSIDILENSSITYEFRTTVTKELHSEKDIRDILTLFKKSTPYFIQQFRDGENLIENSNSPWNENELKELCGKLKEEGHNVNLRGV